MKSRAGTTTNRIRLASVVLAVSGIALSTAALRPTTQTLTETALAAPDCATTPNATLGGGSAPANTYVVRTGSPQSAMRIQRWGFDIKQPAAAADLTDAGYAQQVFGNGNMTILRIPVRTEEGWVDPFTTSGGEAGAIPIENKYDTVHMFDAIESAWRVNHSIFLYASRTSPLEAMPDSNLQWYDADLRTPANTTGYVDINKYGIFLTKYVQMVNQRLITDLGSTAPHVALLGPENEANRDGEGNDGNLTPERFGRLATKVHDTYPSLPEAMNDNNKPDPGWFTAAQGNPGNTLPLQYVTTATTHFQYYNRDVTGPRNCFNQLADVAAALNPPRAVWDTEYHWDQGAQYGDAVDGVVMALDHALEQYSAVIWWAFEPCRTIVDGKLHHSCTGASAKAELMSALVDSTSNLPAVPVDGTDSGVYKRAFKDANYVNLWIANTSSSAIIRTINVPGNPIYASSTVLVERWKAGTDGVVGREYYATEHGNSAGVYDVNLPARSFTLLKLPLTS